MSSALQFLGMTVSKPEKTKKAVDESSAIEKKAAAVGSKNKSSAMENKAKDKHKNKQKVKKTKKTQSPVKDDDKSPQKKKNLKRTMDDVKIGGAKKKTKTIDGDNNEGARHCVNKSKKYRNQEYYIASRLLTVSTKDAAAEWTGMSAESRVPWIKMCAKHNAKISQ